MSMDIGPQEEPVARITLTTIYTEVVKLTGIPSQVSDHEVRIRAIEKYLWIWIGAAGGAGAGITQLVNSLITK